MWRNQIFSTGISSSQKASKHLDLCRVLEPHNYVPATLLLHAARTYWIAIFNRNAFAIRCWTNRPSQQQDLALCFRESLRALTYIAIHLKITTRQPIRNTYFDVACWCSNARRRSMKASASARVVSIASHIRCPRKYTAPAPAAPAVILATTLPGVLRCDHRRHMLSKCSIG